MSISLLCSQCGSPAERCEQCAGALCPRRLCSELREASCAAVSAMPANGHGQTEHQQESFARARDLARTKRDEGWVRLAEGDLLGPIGARSLGRNVRAGCAEPAEHDTFVRIRLAYESAADRLPDVAWPWYRLAELLAWAGFSAQAREHLQQAERRSLAGDNERRRVLRALVDAGLGSGGDGLTAAARPFPAKPFNAPLRWRLGLRPSRSSRS